MIWKTILDAAITGEGSLSAVARAIGYSPSALSQARAGKYPGKTETIAGKVVEIFGSKYGHSEVRCPVLGIITRERCNHEISQGFSTANPEAVELWDTCPDCELNFGG